MLRLGLAVTGLVASFVFSSSAFAQRGESGIEYGWTGDYQSAKATAKRTGKPIMLVFRCIP